LLIAQDVDIATVSKLMGHSNPAVTLKIYAHAIKQRTREAADTLEDFFIKKDD
jgi:integrase